MHCYRKFRTMGFTKGKLPLKPPSFRSGVSLRVQVGIRGEEFTTALLQAWAGVSTWVSQWSYTLTLTKVGLPPTLITHYPCQVVNKRWNSVKGGLRVFWSEAKGFVLFNMSNFSCLGVKAIQKSLGIPWWFSG